MMKKIVTLLLVLNSLFSFSQNANDSLIDYIKGSEKILMASHENLSLPIHKPGKSSTVIRTLLKNGKPNKRIIKEQIQLDIKSKEALIEIIATHTAFGRIIRYSFTKRKSGLILTYVLDAIIILIAKT